MPNETHNQEQATGSHSQDPSSEPGGDEVRQEVFDCCSAMMGEARDGRPCASIMRRHPVITSAILALMGLAVLVIPAGAVLGIIAFFRTL